MNAMSRVERPSPLKQSHERGYHIMYRENETNRCPGCGHTHWIIGRIMAECAFCATALPMEAFSDHTAKAPIMQRGKKW